MWDFASRCSVDVYIWWVDVCDEFGKKKLQNFCSFLVNFWVFCESVESLFLVYNRSNGCGYRSNGRVRTAWTDRTVKRSNDGTMGSNG